MVDIRHCAEILNEYIDWSSEDSDDALDQLRSLRTEGVVTEEEYDYIVQHWDDLIE